MAVAASAAADSGSDGTLDRAKELLDLIKSPTAIATGVLVAFARAQLARNARGIDKAMTFWALLASFGALVIAGVIVGVMTPLTITMLANDGPVETELLVYGLTFAVAVGVAAYAGWVCYRCWSDFHNAE